MYFTKKRFSFEAFDGKGILSVQLDYPADGDGVEYDYMARLADKCLEFVSGKLYDAVKNKYLSEYSDRAQFARYCYILRIIETFSDGDLHSYLITATLRCGTSILSQDVSSVVWYSDMIIPQKLIYRGKYKALFLNEKGIPSIADYRNGQIVTDKVSNKKYSLKAIKPSVK